MKAAIFIAIISAAAVWFFAWCLQSRLKQPFLTKAMICAVGLPLIAWSLNNPWLLHGVMLLWVPFVARKFSQIVPVYLFSLLLLPGLDHSVAIGALKLFEFGVHDALVVGATAAVFFLPGRGKPPPQCDLAASAIVFMLAVGLARDTTLSHFTRMTLNVVLDLGLPYLVVSRGIRTVDELRKAMLWLGCGAVTLAVILLFEVWKAWPLYNELYNRYGLPTLVLVKARAGLLRAGGPFVEPTSIAMVIALCLVALWVSRDSFRSGKHHLLVILLSFAGLSAPQSRGAWIGLFIAVVIGEMFRRRYRQLATKLLVLTSMVSAIFMAAQVSPSLSETIGMSGGSTETSDYRRQLLSRGMEEFWNSPLIGYSMPQLNIVLKDLRQGEGIVDFVNTYIWIMLLCGGLGLLIFLSTFLFFVVRAWRAGRKSRSHDNMQAAAFIVGGLVMMMEMFFFTSFGTRPAYFVFVMFGFAAVLKGKRPAAAISHTPLAATMPRSPAPAGSLS